MSSISSPVNRKEMRVESIDLFRKISTSLVSLYLFVILRSRIVKMFKNINFSSFHTIIFVGLIFRIIAAIFSEGYGMHDDHFLVIEASASWADGYDYNGWLPWSEGSRGAPEGHSFTYVGLNYIFFAVLKWLGIVDPMTQMLINRLIHAVLSVFVIYFGIKITERISNRKNATIVGWILALLWLMPILSVRNLVEMSSAPILLWGVWLAIRDKSKYDFLFAGLIIGLAVSFRYQIGVFALGMAAFYFFTWQWKTCFQFCVGVVLTFCITQGVVDFFIWGYPFAELMGYVVYNMNEGTGYLPNTNYFMYLYVLFGALLFPLGILALIGFFSTYKTQMLLFLPTVIFLLFHTLYPNRQERFVLTILPFVIILSILGIERLRKAVFWNQMWNFSWKAFWVLNIPILLVLTFASTKISRVDAMYALYGNGHEKESILLEASGEESTALMPKFYAKSWYASFVSQEDAGSALQATEGWRFDYIFFFGEDDLEARVASYRAVYPNMTLRKKCEPSGIDKLLRWLNPRNSNEYIEVWETHYRWK